MKYIPSILDYLSDDCPPVKSLCFFFDKIFWIKVMTGVLHYEASSSLNCIFLYILVIKGVHLRNNTSLLAILNSCN